jgi:hypothetical protein
MALDYILVKTVILINYTLILNRIRKDYTKINCKLFLETLASLLPSLTNITTREHLD